MSTIRQLITGSMRLINVVQANENPTAEDMSIALTAFNAMLDSWSTEKLSIFSMNAYYFDFTPGVKTYTLGPGGDWDITRPMEIVSGYVRYNSAVDLAPAQNIDIPMEMLTSEQYAAIAVKNTSSTFPLKFYDDCNYPLRTVTVWPIPLNANVCMLWLWQPLVEAATIDDEFLFPKGYERALRFALANELSAEFGKESSEAVKRIARTSKALIKRLNITPQYMRNDIAIASNKTGYFNYIIGDTVGSTGLL